jgi:hypothetical protein
MKKENLIGQKFTRLLVVAEAEPVGVRKRAAWLCQCDCGNTKIVKAEELKGGDTKSCGCLNDEKRKERVHLLYSPNIKYHPREATARRIWKNRYGDGISFEDFFRLSQMNCYYCGARPNNVQNSAKQDTKSSEYAKENGDFTYNGLDRVNSTLPHTIDNVVPCCKWCNFSKRERSAKDFDDWLERAYQTLLERRKSS